MTKVPCGGCVRIDILHAFDCVDRAQLRAGDWQLPVDRWLSIDTEILIPAAMSYVLTDANVDEVRASLVVQAANVPTVETAQRRPHERGVTVVPDFVVNVATNAWWR